MSALNIYLSSSDRSFGDASDFQINTNILTYSRSQSFNMHLQSFTMSFLEYPINSKTNTLTFQENGVASNLTATLDPGTYSVTDFVTYLKTAMDNAGANTYTITYSSITKKLTITADGVNTIKLIDSSMLELMGFEAGTSFSNSITASYPINLDGTDWIDIYTSLSTDNYKVGVRNRGSLLARIPVNALYGELIDYTNSDEHVFTVNNEDSLQNLEVQLYDDKNRLLELPTNCNCSIVLSLHFE